MDVYTTHFLKTIIKILQQNRQYIKLDQVKNIVEKIMSVDKLDVMANSWPLYFVVSMFLNSYYINDIEGIVSGYFDIICAQLKKLQEPVDISQPMLHFYRLRNLICTFTSIIKYLLCFRTPMTEKTTSSQLLSSHYSQQVGG